MQKQSRPHYFLIVGEILFAYKDTPTAFQTIRVNAVIQHENKKFPAAMIGRAQKAAQMTFFNRIGDAISDVNVVDVVIMNNTYLGEFEQEEFNKLPPDMQVAYDAQIAAEAAAHDALEKAKNDS